MAPAAVAQGVPLSTFWDWLAKGRADGARDPYRAFAVNIEMALAWWEAEASKALHKAGGKDWRAHESELERRLPDRWGKRTKIDGTLAVTARPFIDTSKLTLDEQRQLRELLAKAQPDVEELPANARPALELMSGPLENGSQ